MTQENWSFDQAEEDYPLGIFDDFDGTIINIEFQQTTYKTDDGTERNGTSAHILVKPMEYEYDARDMEWDEDSIENIPQQWYSLGSGDFVISDDLMEIVRGPNPQRSSRIVKFIGAMRKSGYEPQGKSLVSFQNAELHFKAEETTHWQTGKKGSVLWPVGAAVGRSILAAKSEGED